MGNGPQSEVTATDLVLIGAGPIGLEMAVALTRAGISYVHLEKGQIGNTVYHYPPGVQIFSSIDRIALAQVPFQLSDRTRCTREEYLSYLRSIVVQFRLQVRTYEAVCRIDHLENGIFNLTTLANDSERRYESRRIIFAVGDMAGPNLLRIPGENLPHVHHVMREPHLYFRRRVLIVGGRNSAVEAAVRLHRTGAQVSLSYRGDRMPSSHIKYWILPEFESFVERGDIQCYLRTVPVEIRPEAVRLQRNGEDEQFDVPVDFVLLLVGYVADHSLLRMAGVDFQGANAIPQFDQNTMETNVPGVYLAGTVTAGQQQSYRVFIENCHIHVDRILAALRGGSFRGDSFITSQPES